MPLVRLFMAARGAPSTRSAASSCMPGVRWLVRSRVPDLLAGNPTYSQPWDGRRGRLESVATAGGIRNCTGCKINDRKARVPYRCKRRIFRRSQFGIANAEWAGVALI
jgi:hypothetical protein